MDGGVWSVECIFFSTILLFSLLHTGMYQVSFYHTYTCLYMYHIHLLYENTCGIVAVDFKKQMIQTSRRACYHFRKN